MSWIYDGNTEIKSISDFPELTYGFIYLITNVTKEKFYVGKKALRSYRWVKIAQSTYDKNAKDPNYRKSKSKRSRKGKPIWEYRKLVIKETDWLKYTGSNKELNEDIKNGDKIYKEIIDFGKDKRELTYLEAKYQFKKDVLEREDCYNTNILGKFF